MLFLGPKYGRVYGWTRLHAAEPEGSGLFGPPLTEAAGRKPKSRWCSSMAVSSPGLGGSTWRNWLEVLFSFPALAAALRGTANCSAAWSRRCAHSRTISDDDSMSKCKARCYHVDTEIETLCWTLIQFDWRYASINSSCYHPPFPPPIRPLSAKDLGRFASSAWNAWMKEFAIQFMCTKEFAIQFMYAKEFAIQFMCRKEFAIQFMCMKEFAIQFMCTKEFAIQFICTKVFAELTGSSCKICQSKR